jgi:hypothetical protein
MKRGGQEKEVRRKGKEIKIGTRKKVRCVRVGQGDVKGKYMKKTPLTQLQQE